MQIDTKMAFSLTPISKKKNSIFSLISTLVEQQQQIWVMNAEVHSHSTLLQGEAVFVPAKTI